MANTIKNTKTTKKPDSAKLQPDATEIVDWQTLPKDHRTKKFIGSLFLLIGLFLAVSITSYLFTWQTDQSAVINNGSHYLFAEDVQATNILGRLGATVAHFLVYRTFGIAAYVICTFFFAVGINLFFAKKYFSIFKNLKYVLLGCTVFSVILAYLFGHFSISMGGAFGNLISSWLVRFIGALGTGLVMLVAGMGYIIWRFNPSFKLPNFAKSDDNLSTKNYVDNTLDAESALMRDITTNPNQQAANEAFATTNKLKNSNGVVVIPANTHVDNNNTETDSNGVVVQEIPANTSTQKNKKTTTTPDLTLQLKPTSETNEEDEAPEMPDEILDLELNVRTPLVNPKVPLIGSIGTNYEPTLDLADYIYPSIAMLESHGSERIVQDPAELETNKNQIINTLRNYDIEIQKIMATVGPTVTLYEIVPAPGVRISRIKNLEDDIALSLAALGIRIVAPIPGKGTIGIEVPNLKKTIVSMRTLLASDKFTNNNYSLPIALGKKIDNENFIVDLATMPHLLMAGATGQGKSVGLNAVLVSLLYKKHPSQLKLVLVDPKKVELSVYKHIEKHFLAKLPGEEESIITDTKKVVHTLNALCIEMDTRYDLLKEAGCRNIKEYNEKFVARKLNPEKGHQFLPFIVLVIDEFADLIMTAGKEVETPIARLAQLARAIGIHLIIATQRPSVNIITGTIKANFPARIAFKVSSKIDSRTILDAGGAEQLIGKGDMLINYNGELTRLQCAFVDTPEVDKVVAFISEQRGYPQAFMLPEYIDEKDENGKTLNPDERDSLFEDAAKLIVAGQLGSTSLIQRKMKLGYNRSGRIMDQLETAGIVGPNLGNKPRDVYMKTLEDLQAYFDSFG